MRENKDVIFLKSQFTDPLKFLHGSPVENPELEEERYREKKKKRTLSLLVFILPFPQTCLVFLNPLFLQFLDISALYLSSLHSFLTSSSHSLPLLHFPFSLSVTYHSIHSEHEKVHQGRPLNWHVHGRQWRFGYLEMLPRCEWM